MAEGQHRYGRKALLGALIGIAFVSLLWFAGNLGQGDPPRLAINVAELTHGPSGRQPCRLSDAQFSPLATGAIRLGYGLEPDTFRVELVEDYSGEVALLTESMVDHATLYVCSKDGQARRTAVSGDTIAAVDRDVLRPEVVFFLSSDDFDAGVYLGLVQEAAIANMIVAMKADDFRMLSDRRLTLRMVLFGMISMMITYNILLSSVTRHPAFAANALLVSSMLLLVVYLSGFGAAYLWPNSAILSNIMLSFGLAGPCLVAPFYTYFFLRTGDPSVELKRPFYLFWPVFALIALLFQLIIPTYLSWIALTAGWIIMALIYIVFLFRQAWAGNEKADILLLTIMGAAVPAMLTGSMSEFVGIDFGQLGAFIVEISLILDALLLTLTTAYLMRLSQQREHRALQEINEMSVNTNRRLLTVIDEERTRIARDLHDTAGQGVVLVASRLGKLAKQAGLPASAQKDMRATASLTRAMLSEIRQVSHDLHPATLDHLGLNKALVELAGNVEAAAGLQVVTEIELTDEAVSRQQALQIFRIVQELLNNVVKHSGAHHTSVRLLRREARGLIVVEDDGRGLQENVRSEGHGIGTSVLQERVRSLEGDIHRENANPGTRVTVDFPIQTKEAES